MKRDKTKAILDITDVLLQVYKKIDSEKYPEILINKMVNYIYIVGFDNKIHFLGNDEKLLIELGDISKKAEINSKYKANFTDKSQFYSYSEKVPIR